MSSALLHPSSTRKKGEYNDCAYQKARFKSSSSTVGGIWCGCRQWAPRSWASRRPTPTIIQDSCGGSMPWTYITESYGISLSKRPCKLVGVMDIRTTATWRSYSSGQDRTLLANGSTWLNHFQPAECRWPPSRRVRGSSEYLDAVAQTSNTSAPNLSSRRCKSSFKAFMNVGR